MPSANLAPSRLLRALEAHLAGGAPGDCITLNVSDSNDCVVESRTDVRYALFDVLALTAFLYNLLCCCHISFSLLLLICDGLCGTFSGSCISLGTLTSYGKTLSVSDTAIAIDLYEALDVKSYFTTEAT